MPRPLIRLFYGALALLALVIAAGTATTGAGPHAGDASGQQVAKRIPIALRDMAELHSSLALLLIGVTIGLVVAIHMGDVPERVRRAARILMVVLVAQAAVGYTQYFTHLPALLVEVHILGATALVIGAVQTFLACTYHTPETLPPSCTTIRRRRGCRSAPIQRDEAAAPGGWRICRAPCRPILSMFTSGSGCVLGVGSRSDSLPRGARRSARSRDIPTHTDCGQKGSPGRCPRVAGPRGNDPGVKRINSNAEHRVPFA